MINNLEDRVTLADLRRLCAMAEDSTGSHRPEETADELAWIKRIHNNLRALIKNQKKEEPR